MAVTDEALPLDPQKRGRAAGLSILQVRLFSNTQFPNSPFARVQFGVEKPKSGFQLLVIYHRAEILENE